MKMIPLTQGKVALVDDQDYERVARLKWFARKTRHGTWYAAHSKTNDDGTRTTVLMHRFVLGLTPGDPLRDHRNCDGLDNQRDNLRPTDKSGNASNSKVRCDSASGLKGVRIHKGKWSAQIRSKGKLVWLGYFKTAAEASLAYDAAAVNFHGEFARPNCVSP